MSALAGELIDPLELAPSNDPLEVPVAPSAHPVKVLDAIHATKAGGKGFAVTVRGDYYAASAENQGKKVKRPYEVTINLPSLDSALSVIKNKILDKTILRKHKDSLGARTHEIVSAVPLSHETQESNNLQFMNRDRLERYVLDHSVPLDASQYEDVVVLRNAVVDFTLNPKGFEEREAVKQADRKLEAELNALNNTEA
jgi:hypothetical protein